MKLSLSILFITLSILTASAQTGLQNIRMQEVKNAYRIANNGTKAQPDNNNLTASVEATVKRMEAGGLATYHNRFYTHLPEQMSIFKSKRTQAGDADRETEALFNANNRLIFFSEKEGQQETLIYWNNDGTTCLTLQKASANSTPQIDQLGHNFVKEAKAYAEREREKYAKTANSGRFEE